MHKEFKTAFLATTLLYLLVGLAMVLWPTASQRVIFYLAGALLTLYGLFRLIHSLSSKSVLQPERLPGVLALPLGLLLLIRNDLMLGLLGILAGSVLIADALVKFQFAALLKRAGAAAWKACGIAALVLLAGGILLLFDPFLTIQALTFCTGVFLVLNAAADLYALYHVSKLAQQPAQPHW